MREATRWARAIKMLDPQAQLVSCGMNGWNDWDRVVIDGMAPLVDFHSLHIYTGADDYWTNVLAPHQAERAIACARTLIERTAYVKKIAQPPRIAYTNEERACSAPDHGTLEERYNFADALAVGTYLNIFTRNCDWVRMANLAQMVNAMVPTVTTGDGGDPEVTGHPSAAQKAALDTAVDVYTDGPTVDLPAGSDPGRWPHRVFDLGPFPMVDAAATVSSDRGRIALTLVNRNPDQAETAEIVVRDPAFDGPVDLHTVTAAPGTAPGSSSAVPGVQGARVDEGSEAAKGGTVTITLPPQSFTTVEAALAID